MTLISSEQAGEKFEEFKHNAEEKIGNIIEANDDWYYKDKKHLTNSSMDHLIKGGPQTLEAYYEKGSEDKASYIFGRAIHCYLLEPDMFNSRYYSFDDTDLCIKASGVDWKVKNKKPKATKTYKEGLAKIMEENSHRHLLSIEDISRIQAMVNKIMEHKQIRDLLEAAYKRETIYSKTINGVKCKIKVDSIKPGTFILDYKSTKDAATLANAAKAMRQYNYDRKGAFYRDVALVDTFYFLFQEKTYPFTFCLAELSPESYEIGREKYMFGLEMYKRFFKDGYANKEVASFYEVGTI